MTALPPTLREWSGLNPPEICTVASLQRYIPHRYGYVYWIRKMIDNVVVEFYPLTDWHFGTTGKLVGTVDTGEWKLNVSIHLDEYVVLSVK
ncbi:MAG: hypothetical protein H0X30_05610 [Anaerolineae bacterium]|nr:hypothetical protein [Anaerolineae bacterium]